MAFDCLRCPALWFLLFTTAGVPVKIVTLIRALGVGCVDVNRLQRCVTGLCDVSRLICHQHGLSWPLWRLLATSGCMHLSRSRQRWHVFAVFYLCFCSCIAVGLIHLINITRPHTCMWFEGMLWVCSVQCVHGGRQGHDVTGWVWASQQTGAAQQSPAGEQVQHTAACHNDVQIVESPGI